MYGHLSVLRSQLDSQDAARPLGSGSQVWLPVLQLLPGTQGIYGLLVSFITLSKVGLLGGGAAELDMGTGLLIFAACVPIAIVGLISAIYQGKTAAASIQLVAKRPEEFGKSMLFPAMVETYAILSLLISILAVSAIQI